MEKNCGYILFLLWLCYLIISSILLFTRGFLLTRNVQENIATCESFEEMNCISTKLPTTRNYSDKQCTYNEKVYSVLNDHKAVATCLPAKARVVLLIVDALRYDFTIFDNNIKNPLPFQNKMPVIDELINNYPEHSRLYKFIADPPTTTMQRIKALTTGSLPTFIDAGSNFATFEINEDNVIDQLLRNNYTVVFMGDDTWNGLYPNRFLRNYPYPSFNVWDLDTVDEGVRLHLYDELNNTDWNLLIGHFLGVDHCGHRYGPNHPEMERKLKEINSVIKNVVEEIDERTMLFVIGDHGMTSTGDHGGASDDEVTAGFLVYSKQPLMNFDEKINFVKQIDIVPTLSSILGIPIPFQNLGTLILNCIPISKDLVEIENWNIGLYYLWVNVNQAISYIKEYARTTINTFNEEKLNNLYHTFAELKRKLIHIDNEAHCIPIFEDIIVFISDLRKMCEEVWIQFDPFSITRGLLLLFTSIFFMFLITDGIPSEKLPKIFSSSFIPCSYMMLLLAAALGYILYYSKYVDNLLAVIFFVTGAISQIMMILVIIQNWEIISFNWYDRSNKERIPNIICRIVLIFNLCGLFSNSYIIEESSVLLFLLVTIILLGTIGMTLSNKVHIKGKTNIKNILKWPKLKVFLVATTIAALVRISAYFWRCREEQQWCFANLYEGGNITTKIETTKLQWGIAVASLAILVYAVKEWLRSCGNLNGYSLTIMFVKFLPSVSVVCISGFWLLKRFPPNKKQLKLLNSANLLALVTYVITLVGISVTILKPLCIYVLQEVDPANEVKTFPIKENKEKATDRIPIICGLGTVYSSVFTIIGLYMTLVFALLLSDAMAPSAIIMVATAVFVVITTSILRIKTATSLGQLFNTPNVSILVWIILSQYFFYGSGHQPTFPNIQWEAAFIGTSGNFTNNIIPGALIITNTFCSYILMGLLLPLLFIAPFTLFVMVPSLVSNKSNDLQLASTRGEVLLIERSNLAVTSIFVLSCKYIMGHGIRVFTSMLAATIHSRHLMVWNIFAPKFIFESIGMCVTLVTVTISYLIFIRINKKVCDLVVTLSKSN